MKRAALVLGLVLLIGAAFVAGFGYGRWYGPKGEAATAGAGKKIRYYIDPMHPSYKSDKPGIAPDCGMALVPVFEDGSLGGEEAPGADKKVLYYHDPKQPSYRSDKPGVNPETGNDLEPVYETAAPGTISISAEKQQWIGVRTEEARVESGHEMLRAAGRVTADETRVVRVTSRTGGWIEKVMVDFTGRFVRAGEPMFTLYSPELMASQQEYLLAIKAEETMAHSSVPGAHTSTLSMKDSARRRLEHWGLDDAAIQELERTKKPQRSTTIHAPSSGFVLTRNAFPNARVTPETELYTLVDLSRVWIIADVYESDMSNIRMGQTAVVMPTYLPGRKINARVTNILPQVDPQTRTLKVRLDAENPGLVLKPDLFVNVEFHSSLPARLTVASSAVLNSGLRKIVFVAKGDGIFEPRTVETGEYFDGRVEIRSGLRAGEQVVSEGAFLLDSESQMKNPAPPAAAAGQTIAPAGAPAKSSGGHKHD